MREEGKYIYGIIEEKDRKEFPVPGILNSSARPYTVPTDRLSAVVSEAPFITYETTEENMLAHNRVLEEVMKAYDVIPLRFGTIARTESEIHELLDGMRPSLEASFRKLKGKCEFDLSVSIDETELLQEISRITPTIRDLKARLMEAGDQAKLEDKILIGKLLSDEIMKKKIEFVQSIGQGLDAYVLEKIPLKYQRDTALLLNVALLVEKEKINDLEQAVYRLGDHFEGKLHFKYAGPLPPYNFTELKLLVINFETINEARQILRLGEQATAQEIKQAYRELANEFHPDKHQGNSQYEEEFRRATRAYKLLAKYCEKHPQERYDFKPENFGETVVVVDREDQG